ncbi:MAG: hypothetical protein AB1442_06800 [Nitrospirota bacterium]
MICRKVSIKWLLFIGLTMAVLSFSTGTTALAKSQKICTATSNAALEACRSGVTSDFWIEKGKCNNILDSDAREECKADAKDERKEGGEECQDQKEARLDVCDLLGEDPYDPQIDPANFVDPSLIGSFILPNSYFPITRGKSWTYEGGGEIITVTVTDDTKLILGVTCAVVRDVVRVNGEVIEDTEDWFAQDTAGNIWYFGEISQEFEDGELVSLEGSWKAGVDRAKPGIVMKAAPQVGDAYRQEFLLGEAEDVAEVLSVTGSATVPAAACNGDCVVTRDFSPLEPDVEENKYYAPNIGLILEVDVETGARVELTSHN